MTAQAQVLSSAAPARFRIRLWDLPLRIFHWSLVLAVAVAIVTGELGGSWMELHGKAGLVILGLVSFRVVWGLVGSTHARFLSFAPTVPKLRAYLKGQWRGVGHNPLGALSVFALLSLLATQAATGLFSNDDISFNGPLFALIDDALASRLTGWHSKLAYALFGLLALHVVAILAYLRFKRDNLVRPMVTGWKDIEAAPADARSAEKGGPVAFTVAVLVAAAVVFAASGAAS